MPLRSCLLACSLVLGSVLAQESAPEPTLEARVLGRVRDASGQPVEGATVTLHSQLLALRSDLGRGRTERVQTRRGGRFVCRLPAGRAWAAWATWRDAEGGLRATRILDMIGDGSVLDLRGDGLARRVRRLRVRGAEAWRERGPLRYRVVAPCAQKYWENLELDSAGEVELPELPGEELWLEIYDGEGHPLHNRCLEVTRQEVEGEVLTVEIPAPVRVVARVLDFETKKPVPDARLEWAAFSWPFYSSRLSARAAWRPLHLRDPGIGRAVSADEDGLLRLLVCWPKEQVPMLYRDVIARAPGFAGSFRRLNATPVDLPADLDPGDERILRFELHRSRRVEARVLDREGKALAGVACFVSDNAYAGAARDSYMNYGWRLLRTDSAGKLKFTTALPTTPDFVALALTRPQLRRVLPEPDARLRDLPYLSLVQVERQGAGTDAVDLGALGPFAIREIRARRPDGRKATGVRLLHRATHASSSMIIQETCLDREGRGLFVAAPGKHELALFGPDAGYAMQMVTIGEGQGANASPIELELRPLRAFPYRVRDAAGEPLVDAYLTVNHGAVVLGTQANGWSTLRSVLNAHVRSRGRTDAGGRGSILLPAEVPEKGIVVRAVWQDPDGRHHYGEHSAVLHSDTQGVSELELGVQPRKDAPKADRK